MNGTTSLFFQDGCMRVEGVLDFNTVIPLEPRGAAWLREQAPAACRLDLSGVTRSNSAGTALLLSWLRAAHAVDKNLAIENVPQSLRGMMHLAGLEDVLAAI
jgi:phospholipid transport system transporter-binding protein